MPRTIAAAVLCCFGVGTLAQMAEVTSDDERAVLSQRLAFNAAIERNDSDAIRGYLDHPFQITTGAGEQRLYGADDEVDAWREFFASYDDVLYVRTPTTIDVSGHLPRAVEFGTWTGHANMAGESRELSGRYAAAWNKVDGQWKVASELYVTLNCEGRDC